MKQNNNHTISGVIYDIQKQPITGKKDPTQTYFKYTITLEIKEGKEVQKGDSSFYTSKVEYPQYEWFSPPEEIIEKFAIADPVELDFYCSGAKFTYKNGEKAGQEGIISRNAITKIRFADLDGGYKTHKGKITVESTSNIKDLPTFPVAEEDEGDYDKLPF